MPSIREAQTDDVPQLVALMAEFYAEASYPLPATAAAAAFRRLLAEPRWGRVWLLHADDGALGGYVVLTVHYSMEYGGLRGFVDDLYVRPAARRQGLASAALAAVQIAAVELGVRALLVETGPDNTAARRVYAHVGFAASDRLLLTQVLASPVHAQEA